MSKKIVRSKRLRSAVTVIEEKVDLRKLGLAGVRYKLDTMLSAVHGQPERAWKKLSEEERAVLRKIARREDPAWGLSHQVDAIGALGELRDPAALLQLSELARDSRADLRLQVAAAHAVGEIGGEQARPVLQSLLGAKAPEVRAQAVRGLAQAGKAADLASLQLLAKADKTFAGDAAKKAVRALRTRLQVRRAGTRRK